MNGYLLMPSLWNCTCCLPPQVCSIRTSPSSSLAAPRPRASSVMACHRVTAECCLLERSAERNVLPPHAALTEACGCCRWWTASSCAAVNRARSSSCCSCPSWASSVRCSMPRGTTIQATGAPAPRAPPSSHVTPTCYCSCVPSTLTFQPAAHKAGPAQAVLYGVMNLVLKRRVFSWMQVPVDNHHLQHNVQRGAVCAPDVLPGHPRDAGALQPAAEVHPGQVRRVLHFLAGACWHLLLALLAHFQLFTVLVVNVICHN